MDETGLSVEVYVDILILVNFIMDFLILWVAGKLTSFRIRIGRLIAAALLGAFYSLVVFLPENTIYTTLIAKILCSVLMVLLAYAPMELGAFFRAMCYLYIASFAMGGAVIGAIYLSSSKSGDIQVLNGAAILPVAFNYPWLLVGVITAIFLGNGGVAWVRKNILTQKLVYHLIISIDEKEIFVEALLDTGNQLTDPVTQKPVIILGTQALKGYVPEKVLKAVGSNEDNRITSLGEGLEAEWVRRLRLINFNSVGKKQGLMIGLRVDYIEVRTEKKKIRSEDIVIGLIDGVLTKSGKYQALLPPLLFEEYCNKEDLYAPAAGENIGIKL